MLNSKNAKKLNRSQTIDLKYIYAKKYCNKIENKNIIIEQMKKIISIVGIVWFIIVTCVGWEIIVPNNTNAYNNKEYNYYGVDNARDYERKIRLEVCGTVYRKNREFVDNTFIHTDQDVVVRCGTMMGLIGAYETGFFTSRKYMEDNNEFGIKDYYTGKFKIYNSTYESKLDFAEKYLVGNGNSTFRGHKNRNITEFIRNWSGDDIETENRYINFVSSKYRKMYNELLILQ